MTFAGLLILTSGFFLMTVAGIPAVRPRVQNLFYGWKLVGVSLLVLSLAGGPILNGVGVWVRALEMHFGWSRTQLTGAFSLAQLEGSVSGPVVGYLIDRLGPRRMVFIGLSITGIGFIMFSRTTSIPSFYLAYMVIMVGIASGTWLPVMVAINRWFNRRRGTAMAIAGEGTFLGGLLLVPVMAWAVTPGHVGWSATAQWIGVVFLVGAWPISHMIRSRPQDYGLLPDGDPPPLQQTGQATARYGSIRSNVAANEPDFTVGQALRTRAFWFITFGHALTSMLNATLTVHMVPLLTDQGLSLQTASYVWATLMGVGTVFQLVGGYLGDRLPTNMVLVGFSVLQAGGFMLAAFVHGLPMAILFAVVFGVGFGGRVPLTTSIRGDYFGSRAFGTITGISTVAMYGFMLAAPMFAAIMFDAQGSYLTAFLVLGLLGSTSVAFFWFAKKPVLVEPAKTVRAMPSRT